MTTHTHTQTQTMYIGEPHNVAAMTPSCRNRAKPKSATNTSTHNRECPVLSSSPAAVSTTARGKLPLGWDVLVSLL